MIKLKKEQNGKWPWIALRGSLRLHVYIHWEFPLSNSYLSHGEFSGHLLGVSLRSESHLASDSDVLLEGVHALVIHERLGLENLTLNLNGFGGRGSLGQFGALDWREAEIPIFKEKFGKKCARKWSTNEWRKVKEIKDLNSRIRWDEDLEVFFFALSLTIRIDKKAAHLKNSNFDISDLINDLFGLLPIRNHGKVPALFMILSCSLENENERGKKIAEFCLQS